MVQGLLKGQAHPNNRSLKDQPQLGFAPLVLALHLALTYKLNEVASALLAAQAELHRGLPDMTAVAQVNNVEGMRLLCQAKGNVGVKNVFGFSALQVGAAFGALEAVDEIVRHVPQSPLLRLQGIPDAPWKKTLFDCSWAHSILQSHGHVVVDCPCGIRRFERRGESQGESQSETGAGSALTCNGRGIVAVEER